MKNIFCVFNIHRWKIISSTTADNLIYLIKNKKRILKKSTYKLEKNFTINDKRCLKCDKILFEINYTRKFLEKKLVDNLKIKLH